MAIEIGSIIEGKVTGVAKFGAFVGLEGGASGLVHISEISAGFVTDVAEHLKVGDEVKVKVVSIDDKGRINLSIRQAQPKPEAAPRPERAPRPRQTNYRPDPIPDFAPQPKAPASFEDMLQKFKQDSDSKLSDLKSKEDGGRRKRSRK
ncbi:MAG: S1 RNA-binding domain-containing protein [Clostridia bacterium]|nr:S1 RNA-binding domain-containing protein [Clostridia bacterium]MBQ1966044.1 S1 RNA-binding domain-containing protein [Clostridia bacterium]